MEEQKAEGEGEPEQFLDPSELKEGNSRRKKRANSFPGQFRQGTVVSIMSRITIQAPAAIVPTELQR
jgi:hypothetical protein